MSGFEVAPLFFPILPFAIAYFAWNENSSATVFGGSDPRKQRYATSDLGGVEFLVSSSPDIPNEIIIFQPQSGS